MFCVGLRVQSLSYMHKALSLSANTAKYVYYKGPWFYT